MNGYNLRYLNFILEIILLLNEIIGGGGVALSLRKYLPYAFDMF